MLAHFFLFSYFKLDENAWYQRQKGVLEETQWSGWEIMLRAFYHAGGVQNGWWPRRRHAYSLAFQAYLANSQQPADAGSLEDLFASEITP